MSEEIKKEQFQSKYVDFFLWVANLTK